MTAAAAAPVLPATWGVTNGSGLLGSVIHVAERAMSHSDRFPDGDTKAAWAGHAVVAVGSRDFGRGLEPAIVQAEWPKVRLDPARVHVDTVWATGQPLTEAQRQAGTAKALSLVGTHYDPLVYALFTAKVLGVAVSRDLTSLFTDPHWIICSGVVVVTQEAMGVDLGPLRTAATPDPDMVTPADCYRWGLDNHWLR